MEMRSTLLRIARIALIAGAAWAGYAFLSPKGLGWVVPVVALGLALVWVGYRFVVVRRRRAELAQADRWADALMSPPERPAAVTEIKAALARCDRASAKGAHEHARLSLVLAELLEADGEPAEAIRALAEVKLDALSERMRTLVAHARAVASISAGDAEAAQAALEGVPSRSGDKSIDMRVRLMKGVILAERGEAERALEIAEQARKDASGDSDLVVEARLLKAIALDALGDRADAVKVMRAIGEDVLGVLVVLGLPRVKKLAEAALVDE
jgi:tetratricopeptide (TPR) repeat protein